MDKNLVKHFYEVQRYCFFRIKNLREQWDRLKTVKEFSSEWSDYDEQSLISLKARVREVESLYQLLLDNHSHYKVPYFINRENAKLKKLLSRKQKTKEERAKK